MVKVMFVPPADEFMNAGENRLPIKANRGVESIFLHV